MSIKFPSVLLTGSAALLVLALPLQHCATPTAPRGGAIDSLPPQLVDDASTPNFQTNFRPEQIELTFDEWVALDPQQKIVISPPITFGPDQRPRLERRTLVIPLEGVELLDDVTYVVNIGAAVEDLNEGNPTENLRFVFATGEQLDSAEVSGTLVDAFTGDPLDATTFTLYGNLADSAVYTENPTYFAQTGEDGRFTVYNVKPGRYRAVALLRNAASTNYYLDFDGNFAPASVGFVDTLVTISDGVNALGEVRLSPVPIDVRVTSVDTSSYGLVALTLNQPAAGVDLAYGGDYLRDNDKDTVRLFYTEPVSDTILLGLDSLWMDTVALEVPQAPSRSTAGPPYSLQIARSPSRNTSERDAIRLTFNRPLDSADVSKIRLLQDTLPEPIPVTARVDTTQPRTLLLGAPRQSRTAYALVLQPGAVTDYLGVTNRDTIRENLKFASNEDYGVLNLTLAELNPTFYYVLRLVRDGEAIIGSERYIEDRFEYSAEYAFLRPGKYQIELLYDANRNNRYDGGDFRFFRQPEAVRRFDIEEIRANWEVEERIVVED